MARRWHGQPKRRGSHLAATAPSPAGRWNWLEGWSFGFMAASVACSLVLGLLLALMLNKRFSGRWLVQSFVLLPVGDCSKIQGGKTTA